MSKVWTPNITKSDLPIYMSLVRALERDIVSDSLRSGDRLPTHRELANQLGLAIGTITKAYREAERRGLIVGDGRRGTFVGRQSRASETLLHLASADPGIIDLSPYFPPADTDPDLQHALAQLARRDIQHLITYTGPKGYDLHCAAGARWVTGLGMNTDENSIVITAGAQHAILVTLITMAERGDVVACEKHTYPGLKWVAEILGLRLVGVESDDGGLLPDSLRSCCRKHRVKFIYCIPTLHNPTNATLSRERRHALAEIAEEFDLLVLEDEINRKLIDDPAPLISSMVPHRSCLIASLSKVVAGGLRICYLVTPPASREKLYKAVAGTTLMVSPLLAELATMWISDGTVERTVARKRAEAEKRSRVALEVLEGLDFNFAPSSYFIWLKLPERWHRSEFARETHHRGVIVAPSDIFAVDSRECDNAVRICLGGRTDMETLRRGLSVVASIARGNSGSDSVVI